MPAPIEASAPHGFLIYFRNVHPVMQLAGDRGDCAAYPMGNHTIAERVFISQMRCWTPGLDPGGRRIFNSKAAAVVWGKAVSRSSRGQGLASLRLKAESDWTGGPPAPGHDLRWAFEGGCADTFGAEHEAK